MYKKIRKKTAEIIFYLFWAVVLIALVIIQSIPLSILNACIAFVFVILARTRENKQLALKSLSKKYDNQTKLLNAIFKHSPDLIYFKDINFKYTTCNEAFLNMIGIANKYKVLSKTDFDILPYKVAKNVRVNDELAQETKQTTKYNQKIILGQEEKIYETIKTPIFANNKIQGMLGISRDITENYNLQKMISQEHSYFEAILNNAPYAAYFKDLSGRIIVWNNKVEKHIFGGKSVSLNQCCYDILPDKYVEDIKAEDCLIIKEKKNSITQKRFLVGKEELWYDIHKAPIFDDYYNVVGIVVIIKDITAEKNIEAQKETFVATLTHDLKTPTYAQIKALKLLLNNTFGELKQSQKEIVEEILHSCNYMETMISMILTVYKNEAGALVLNYEKFNFYELVNECLNEIHYLSEEKLNELIFSSSLNDCDIIADKLGMKRVIINLISNAISYSNKNSEIKIKIKDTDNSIIFEVKNFAKYISQDDIELLFEQYISQTNYFEKNGTGLGLYLAKKIVEKHKGTMIAQSDAKGEITFGFFIPKVPIIETDEKKALNYDLK